MQLEVVISKILERIKIIPSKLSYSISRVSIRKHINFDNKNVILICDSVIASISLFVSIQLRIGIDFFDSYVVLLSNIVVFGLVSASTFIWFGTNNKSLNNINKLLLAIIVSNVTFIPLMYFMNCNIDIPFSILIINLFVMSCILIGLKYIYYNLHCKVYTLLIGNNESILLFLNSHEGQIHNYLQNIRIINSNPYVELSIQNNNIPVIGNINEISNILQLNNINQVIITDNNLSRYEKSILLNLSKQHHFILLQNCTYSNEEYF